MDAGDLAFLESADALMTAAVDATSEHRDPIRAVAALRRDERFAAVPAVRMATALTQARLRVAAVTKFGADADRLWFTPAGLEQATTRRVADHRAARLDGLAGPGHVLDLCCGVGADLAAFARTGRQVIGVDLDSVTAAVAAANLRALGLPGSTVVADAAEVEHASAAAVFVDPSRRSPRGRVFDPDAYRPPWSFVESLLGRDGLAAAKVAPGLDHALVPRHVEADWVSLDGDLREACLWSPAPGAARRRATVLSARSSATCTDLDLPAEPVTAHEPGRYLYEPDDAVIRAHLVGVVAARTEGWLLDPHLAYVSADRLAPSALARAFEVLDTLPFRERRLRDALRSRGIGTLTIKKRGIAIAPEDLRRRLALKGDGAATIVLTRTPRSATCLLVQPLDRDGQAA